MLMMTRVLGLVQRFQRVFEDKLIDQLKEAESRRIFHLADIFPFVFMMNYSNRNVFTNRDC